MLPNSYSLTGGIKVTSGIVLPYRPAPGYIGWRAGTRALCRSQLYHPVSDYRIGYWVQRQHPLTQWILRGDRLRRLEKSTVKMQYFWILFQNPRTMDDEGESASHWTHRVFSLAVVDSFITTGHSKFSNSSTLWLWSLCLKLVETALGCSTIGRVADLCRSLVTGEI